MHLRQRGGIGLTDGVGVGPVPRYMNLTSLLLVPPDDTTLTSTTAAPPVCGWLGLIAVISESETTFTAVRVV